MKLKRLKVLLVSSVLAITMLTGCATPSVSGDGETQESSQSSDLNSKSLKYSKRL